MSPPGRQCPSTWPLLRHADSPTLRHISFLSVLTQPPMSLDPDCAVFIGYVSSVPGISSTSCSPFLDQPALRARHFAATDPASDPTQAFVSCNPIPQQNLPAPPLCRHGENRTAAHGRRLSHLRPPGAASGAFIRRLHPQFVGVGVLPGTVGSAFSSAGGTVRPARTGETIPAALRRVQIERSADPASRG